LGERRFALTYFSPFRLYSYHSNFFISIGNVPAIARLLQTYLEKASQYVLANNQLENFLGVFQKLMSSKANDIYGFQLLEAIFRYIPL
jgi:exportin-2 (importin alpha re-exporter)